MKKLIIGLMVMMVMAANMFGAVELTFWHGIESPDNVAILKDKIKEFEAKNPGITVKAQNYGAQDQVNGKIMTAVAGNKAPDLMWWAPAFTGHMAKTGKLVKIQDLIKNDKSFNKGDVYEGLWEVSMYKGEIWTVPFEANNLGLYYNKKLLKEAGINPESIKTWDDLLAAAKKLTKDTNKDGQIDQYGFQVPMGKNEWTVWTWQTLLWQAGGEFLQAPNYNKVTFNSKAGVDATQFWVDLVNKYKVANFSEPDAGYKTDDFLAGRVAMMINGPWNYGSLEEAREKNGFEYGVVFLPKKERYATNIGGENLFVFKSNPEKEKAAWTFSKYIMSTDFQVDWAMKTGYLPVCKSANENPKYKDFLSKNAFIKTFVDQMQYGKARPSIPEYNKISTELGKELEKILYGKTTPKEGIDKAALEAQKELK